MKHFTIMLDMHKSPILGAQSDRFLTGFQFPTSWPTSTCCWHSPQPTIKPPEEKKEARVFKRGARKPSKNAREISGETEN